MKFDLHTADIRGKFVIDVLNKDGELVRTSGEQENIITNHGLNSAILYGEGLFTRTKVAMGTGTTTPSYADTVLVNKVGTLSGDATFVSVSNSGAPDYVYSLTYRFTGAIGNVVGNLAELGLESTSSPFNLKTRALIKDSSGNPTTISVSSSEQVIVTYTLFSIPNLNDITGSFDLQIYDGATLVETKTIGYTARMIRAMYADQGDSSTGLSQYSPFPNSYSLFPLGCSVSNVSTVYGANSDVAPYGTNGTRTAKAYVNNSFRSSSYYTWTIAQANTTIRSLCLSGDSGARRWWQIILDEPIVKTSSDTLRVDVSCTIGRA